MRLFAPAFSTADRASIPISAVRAIIGNSRRRTSRMYLQRNSENLKKIQTRQDKEEVKGEDETKKTDWRKEGRKGQCQQ